MKRVISKIVFSVSVVSFGILVAPANLLGLGITFVLCLGLSVFLWLANGRFTLFRYIHKEYLLYDISIALVVGQDFYSRWIMSSKIARLAGFFRISVILLLSFLTTILCVLTIWSIDTLIANVNNFIEMHQEKQTYIQRIILLFMIFVIQYLILEYSSAGNLSEILHKSCDVFAFNIIIICAANLFLLLILQKWKRTLIIVTVLFSLWSIANYYTIKFHGSPLFLSEFVNARTAATVAFTYRYNISFSIVCIVILYITGIYAAYRNAYILGDGSSFIWKTVGVRFAVLFGSVLILVPLYMFSSTKDRPWMPWNLSLQNCGFMLCTVEDVVKRADPVFEPEGYESGKLPSAGPSLEDSNQNYPDIILILNETFCDLEQYLNLNPDKDPLADYTDIHGAIYGYAAVPSVGGGTNNSEFELLTSKSMYLLKSSAPFTYLKSEILERNTVQYLESFGYSTVGMHCEQAQNYSRDTAYQYMGFDKIMLGGDLFSYVGTNGNRAWLDADNYHDLTDCYETMDENPRFLYLLTFQNHGGYEQNDVSMDTIHVQNDFGSLTDDIDEYLSSLELSATAFRDLTDYYTNIDRNVIICMVGDHLPSFIPELPAKREMAFEESEIVKRLVPYVIWTNFASEIPFYTEYASMVDLLPMLMKLAGIPLTTFYQYILDMHEKLPIRTSNNIYMNRNGQFGMISENEGYDEAMKPYYYMEYNSLLFNGDYRKELFEN